VRENPGTGGRKWPGIPKHFRRPRRDRRCPQTPGLRDAGAGEPPMREPDENVARYWSAECPCCHEPRWACTCPRRRPPRHRDRRCGRCFRSDRTAHAQLAVWGLAGVLLALLALIGGPQSPLALIGLILVVLAVLSIPDL